MPVILSLPGDAALPHLDHAVSIAARAFPRVASAVSGNVCPVGHDVRWSMSAVGLRLRGDVAARSGIGSRPRRCASSVVLLAAAIGGLRKTVRRLCRVLRQCRTMTGFELVTAADVQFMQGLAQRLNAARPDLVGAGA